jgi:hypothetical protein
MDQERKLGTCAFAIAIVAACLAVGYGAMNMMVERAFLVSMAQ